MEIRFNGYLRGGLFALGACGEGVIDEDPWSLATDSEAVNGVQSLARPEVVSINTSCSGVLIMPDAVLTAGHCLPNYGHTPHPNMMITVQAPKPTSGNCPAGWVDSCPPGMNCIDSACNYNVPVIDAHNFAGISCPDRGADVPPYPLVPPSGGSGIVESPDLALLLLQWPVPNDVAYPARIADTLPAINSYVTLWGYGPGYDDNGVACSGHSGVKRYRTFRFQSNTSWSCSGDSGGRFLPAWPAKQETSWASPLTPATGPTRSGTKSRSST